MRRHDHLAVALAGDLPQERVHVPLQDDVLVGVGFVQEHYRTGPGIEEAEEQKYLERTAAYAGKIERAVAGRLGADGGLA